MWCLHLTCARLCRAAACCVRVATWNTCSSTAVTPLHSSPTWQKLLVFLTSSAGRATCPPQHAPSWYARPSSVLYVSACILLILLSSLPLLSSPQATCFYKRLLDGDTYTSAFEAAKQQVHKFQLTFALAATEPVLVKNDAYALAVHDKPTWLAEPAAAALTPPTVV